MQVIANGNTYYPTSSFYETFGTLKWLAAGFCSTNKAATCFIPIHAARLNAHARDLYACSNLSAFFWGSKEKGAHVVEASSLNPRFKGTTLQLTVGNAIVRWPFFIVCSDGKGNS